MIIIYYYLWIMDWYHYCSTCIFFVQAVDNLGAEYYCMDLQGQVIINIITVKPLLRDPLLNSHPLWSGHQSNSRSLFSIFTVKYLTSIEQSPYPWFQRLSFCYLIPDSSQQLTLQQGLELMCMFVFVDSDSWKQNCHIFLSKKCTSSFKHIKGQKYTFCN